MSDLDDKTLCRLQSEVIHLELLAYAKILRGLSSSLDKCRNKQSASLVDLRCSHSLQYYTNPHLPTHRAPHIHGVLS